MKRRKTGIVAIVFLWMLLLCLGGCKKDVDTEDIEAERSSREGDAALALREQLQDPEVDEIELSEDVTVMGCLTVNGSKTIRGEGTILLAKSATKGVYQDASIWEDEQNVTEEDLAEMPESSVLYVGDGAELTLEGNVVINSNQVGNGVVVGEGGTLTVKEEASLTGGNFCNVYSEGNISVEGGSYDGAKGYNIVNAGTLSLSDGTLEGEASRGNIYSSGELTITGGQLTKAGAYNVFVADGGSASLSGGSIVGAGTANVLISDSGEAKITGEAAIISGTAGIVNYGTLDVEKATIELNMTNIQNYGTANIKESDIQQSTVNNIVNEETGSLAITDTNVTNSGAIAIHNNKGSISFEGLAVRRAGGSAVYNSGGDIEGENLVIYGSSGTAIDNMDSPDGTGGNVEIHTVEIQTGTGMNVVQESRGEMTLTDAMIGTTSITNIKLVSGTLNIDEMELLGTTATGAGIWTIGGKLNITNSTIASTKGRGLALAGGEITGENITFQDVVNTGIDGMLHDNGYTSATAVLSDISFSGGERDNVAVTAKNADITIDGGSFGKTLGNNVRATNGELTLNSVDILGNEYVSGGNTNYHGVYLSGGAVTLNDCTIQHPLACAVRNKGGELRATNLKTYNTPEAAITNAYHDNKTSYGDIYIDGLTTVNAELGAVRNDCPGTVTVENGEFGESPANQAMVTAGSMYLTDVVIERAIKPGTDNYHSVYVTGGYLGMKSVELKDSDCNGIRQTGGTIVGDDVTISNAKVNGINVSGGQTTLKDSVLESTLRTNVNVTAEGAAVVLDNVQVKGAGDTAGNNVNCIYIAPGAEVTLKNGTQVSGSATRAGILSEGGRLYIDGAEIFKNATRGINLANKSVTDETTGVTTVYTPYAEIKNVNIHDNGNNTVTGGAIYNEGTLTLTDSTLRGNTSTSGGAINLGNASRTSLRNVSIIGNSATGNGGGIHVSSGSFLTISGGNIESNRAGGNGNAIRVNSADFYMTDGARVASDNDIYLERNCTIKTTGTGIGNTPDNPLMVTLADSNYGTIVVENDSTGEAARIGSNVVCKDRNGNVLEVTPFDTYLVLGGENEIDYVARVVNRDGTYRYFTTLNAAISAVPTDGTQTRIEVIKDITLNDAIDIPQNGNRNILLTDDGNGPYTITRNFTGERMIILRTGNQLTLEGSSRSDSNPSLILDGGGLAAETNQQIICVGTTAVNKNATLTMNAGVKLTNNKNSNGGGAIIVYGSLRMNGGVIDGNESTNDHGGAIYVMTTGEMTIGGGTISNNTSSLDGGAVMVNGSGRLTMTGGRITGNAARSGGAIILNYSSSACGAMTMSGGTISDNTATSNGGGIFVHTRGVLTMAGGTISGNEADNGGGVYLHYNATNGAGTMTMSGGTIRNNAATGNGGGVGMANTSNTLAMTGGTIRSNTSGGNGMDAYVVGTLSMRGTADVGSLYLTDNNMITISGSLSDRSTITEVLLSSYPEGRKVLDGEAAVVAAGCTFFETPEESGVDINSTGCLESNGEAVDHEARIVKPDGSWTGYMTLQGAIDAAATDGTQTRIEVMKDITLTAALDIPQDENRNILLTDDGNGPYTITRAFTGGTMIILRTGNEMTLEGSSGDDSNPSLILDGAGLAAASDQGIIKVGTNTSANYHATLTVNAGVKLCNNKSGSNGSAIRVYGTLNMNGGVLDGNETTGTGGAISVEITGAMNMTGGTISNNKSAKEGGGIVVYGNGKLTMDDGTITGNQGTAGGAICTLYSNSAGGTVTINGGAISNNTGTANGGAIFIHAKGVLTITGGTISGNKGKDGGAVYLHHNATNGDGTMNMSGGTISGNTATGNGGGVGMANAANTLTMSGGIITGNAAGGNGNGVYVAGTLNMSGEAYADEVYLVAGRAINLTAALSQRGNLTEIVLPSYTAGTKVLGGVDTIVAGSYQYFKVPEESGVEIDSTGTLTSTGETVDYEARVRQADGSYAGYMTLAEAIAAVPTDGVQTRVEIMKDITLTAALDIPQDEHRNILLTDDGNGPYTITRAFTGGRMIILRTGNQLTLEGSSKDDGNPSLILDGGALDAKNDQQIICVGTSTTNKDATLTLEAGVKLTNNKNANGGGAVIVFGNMVMNGGVLEKNISTGDNGGAIFVHATGKLTMNDGVISDNEGNNGGAVYLYQNTIGTGVMAMRGGTISGNVARSTGGGIYIQNGGMMTMESGIISENQSTKEGGGILVNGTGKLTIEDGTITGNQGTAGGAICTLYSNSAGGTVIINGGTISDNTGTANGGAIFIHAKGVLTITGGTISGNKGKDGGAVYLHHNATNGDGIMNMSGGTISGNTATGNGGGVGMANAANSLAMTGGTVSGNTAGGTGMDIHVAGSFSMEGSATAGSVYLADGKTVTLTAALSQRENRTEIVMPAYEVDTQVLNGDATVLTESYSYFKVPDSSGMVITEAGTLGTSINISGVAGLALKNVLSRMMYQVQLQFCQTAGIGMNF